MRKKTTVVILLVVILLSMFEAFATTLTVATEGEANEAIILGERERAVSTGDENKYRLQDGSQSSRGFGHSTHQGFDVAGLAERNWSFETARDWGDFAYVDEDSAELVVGLSDAKLEAYVELSRIIDMNGGQLVNTVSIGEVIWAVVADVPFDLIPSFVSNLKATGLAKYLEPNMRFQIQFVPNDPDWSWQWGPQKIDADWAWNTTIGDPAVLVGVVDSGIDWNHPDLAANYVALGYDWVNNDADPMDDHGHGTHCAGIIAASLNNGIGIAGLAQVRIMAEKGLDSDGGGWEDDLANAILHAVDQGVDILSNSWGGYGESALINDAVKYAYDAGVLIVAAAGNDATHTKSYPAAYDEVVAVTATDVYDNPAGFTNYGDWVEVAAPGVAIWSTVWDDSYTHMFGTSMSTPHVSGVAALIWSQFPYMTCDQVRAQLRRTADDLGDPGFDKYYGYGRINARRAVEQALPEHDILIFDYKRPSYVKLGELTTFNVTVLNFGTSNEHHVDVQLLVNGSLADSTSIAFLPSGRLKPINLSWTPIAEATYNVTSYVVPVPGETIIHNNLITEIVPVVAPPPETNWDTLATDPDEGFGTNLLGVFGQLHSNVIFFKVMHYRAWTTITDINTAIFVDSDQNTDTGLPDGTYPGQNTNIGADYLIVVGFEATEMWKWDPITSWWDPANPISLVYLDTPDGANVFIVGIYLADVLRTTGAIDGAVSDTVSEWDWMPDTGHFTLELLLEHELAVCLEAPTLLELGDSFLLSATVYNIGLSTEIDVELQLLINGTVVNSTTTPELQIDSSTTINYSWTPTVEAMYTVTAYAPPVLAENFTVNNIQSAFVEVHLLPDILLVADDDGAACLWGTSLVEFEQALTVWGHNYFVWIESSRGHPSLEFLLNFKLVIWTSGDYFGWAVDPVDAATLAAYFALGGNILLEGEDIGFDHGNDGFMMYVAHAMHLIDDTGAVGLTITVPTHPVTQGLPTSFTWLIDPPYDDGVAPTNGGLEIIRYTYTSWTAVTVFNGTGSAAGSVVYYAFPIYTLLQPERDTLAINSINWLLSLPVHDVAVTNVTSSKPMVGQGLSMTVNVTVENRGDLPEAFNVTVYYGNETLTPEQWETFWSMGDVNRDDYINDIDGDLIMAAFGSFPGDPNWNPDADLNNDAIVDTIDWGIWMNNYDWDVWTYFNILGGSIGTQTVNNLSSGNSMTLVFTWNTTGIPYGNHIISAKATRVPGETDTAANTFDDGEVFVTIPGDVDGDGDVDGFDLTYMCGCYGSTPGNPKWDENCDINEDGVIDGFDLTPACGNYGKTI